MVTNQDVLALSKLHRARAFDEAHDLPGAEFADEHGFKQSRRDDLFLLPHFQLEYKHKDLHQFPILPMLQVRRSSKLRHLYMGLHRCVVCNSDTCLLVHS